MNTYACWVVCPKTSALLTHNHHIATLALPKDIFSQLPPHSYVQPSNHKKVEYYINLETLIKIKILVKNGNHYTYQDQHFELTDFRALLNIMTDCEPNHFANAIQAIKWTNDIRFCSQCGKPVLKDNTQYVKICHSCNTHFYPKIQPCVIVAIIKNQQILLAQHHRHKDGMYGLIAGFVEIGESLECAIHREVNEEVGIMVKNIRYIGSQAWPYPSNLMVGFVAEWHEGTIKIADDELTNACFFDFDNLPKIPMQGTIARQLIEWVIKNH